MLESIEKLRASQYVGQHMTVNEIADAIEQEISERYMPLPVDADGVPIRVGDRLSHANNREFVVNGITFYHNTWRVVTDLATLDDGFQMRWAKECHHVKPRTLTDVLADLFDRKMTVTDAEHEISELLGGDAE